MDTARPQGLVLPILAALAAMASFQGGAAVAKGLFPAIGPQGTAALRLSLGAVILVALTRPWRRWPARPPLAALFSLGACMAGVILLFYLAMTRLPLGEAIALQFLGPLGVAVAESRRPGDLVWTALAAGGVWSLVGAGGAAMSADPLGLAFALGAAACWAGYIVFGRTVSARFGSATAAVAVGLAAILILPVGIAHAGAELVSPRLLPLALTVAVLSTALPFSLEFYAMARMPPRVFATLSAVEPAFGVLFGLVLLHERLSPAQMAGVAAVIAAAAGAAWADTPRKARPGPPPT
jgi:inner membrane transporter RhtA